MYGENLSKSTETHTSQSFVFSCIFLYKSKCIRLHIHSRTYYHHPLTVTNILLVKVRIAYDHTNHVTIHLLLPYMKHLQTDEPVYRRELVKKTTTQQSTVISQAYPRPPLWRNSKLRSSRRKKNCNITPVKIHIAVTIVRMQMAMIVDRSNRCLLNR